MPVFLADVSIGDFSDFKHTYSALDGWCRRAFPTARLPGVDLEPAREKEWRGPRLGLHATFIYLWRGPVDEKLSSVISRSGMLSFDFPGSVRGLKAIGDENYGLLILEFFCPEFGARATEVFEMIEEQTGRAPKMTRHLDDPTLVGGFNPHITIAQFSSLAEAEAAMQESSISAELRDEWDRSFRGKSVRMHNFRAIE